MTKTVKNFWGEEKEYTNMTKKGIDAKLTFKQKVGLLLGIYTLRAEAHVYSNKDEVVTVKPCLRIL